MTLYRLSLVATAKFLDPSNNVESIEDLSVLGTLPISLQRDVRREIKRNWMKDTLPPENPHLYEYRYLNFNSLDKHEFIMLMRHPKHLHPEFWPSYSETGHLTTDYYEHHIGNQKPFNLCHDCFQKRCSPSIDDDFVYHEYWKSLNWRFFNIVRHCDVTPKWFVCNVLKSKKSWCDWCVLAPLFQLYSFDKCTQFTHFHDDDSESNDSFVKTFSTTEVFDPFIH